MKRIKKLSKLNSKEPVESVYWTEITYTCPKRGKVTEKVQVKKLKGQPTPESSSSYELEILQNESLDDQ